MKAMLFHAVHTPLTCSEIPDPQPGPGEVLLRVVACAVCRTDLHIVDGELAHPKRPVVPGHEIVGRVVSLGAGVQAFQPGDRVGVPWLGWTCGVCRYCRSGQENLCPQARFTGYQIDGGYAEYSVADARYCFPIPDVYIRRGGRAAALRRADRLSLPAHGWRRRSLRHLRLRCGRAHYRTGSAASGTARLCFHADGGCPGAGIRTQDGGGMGRSL